LKAYSGSYRLIDSADGKGTVLVAELNVDVRGMVPKFMVDRFISKSFDETGKALTAYAKKLPVQAAAPARGPVAEAKPRRAKRVMPFSVSPNEPSCSRVVLTPVPVMDAL